MPTRTCIGCRDRADQADLVRLVWIGDRVRTDPRRTGPGRGAYLHDVDRCWELAIRRRAVGRALRLSPEQAAVAAVDELAATRPTR